MAPALPVAPRWPAPPPGERGRSERLRSPILRSGGNGRPPRPHRPRPSSLYFRRRSNVKPPPGAPVATRHRKPPCPKCQGPMEPVSGWNWCHRCGHRAVSYAPPAPEVAAAPDGPGRQPGAGRSELGQAARLLPLWFWVLLGGLAVIGGASFAANLHLPSRWRERAVWSTVQFLLGVLSFLLAGVWVSGRLGKDRSTFGLLDLLLPDRLWPRALKCLPATRWQVCAGA